MVSQCLRKGVTFGGSWIGGCRGPNGLDSAVAPLGILNELGEVSTNAQRRDR